MKTALWSLFRSGSVVVSVAILSGFSRADSLGIKLTGNTPVSNVSVSGSQKNGSFGLGGGFEYLHPVGRFDVGAELDILSRSRSTGSIIPHVTTQASGLTTQVLGIGRVRFLRDLLYVGAGVGIAHVSLKGTGKPQAGYTWSTPPANNAERVLVDESATGFAYALRGGFEIPVSARFTVGYELGYNGTSSMTFGSLKGSTNSITNSVCVRVKL